MGQNEFDCSSVCEWDRYFQRCYRYDLLNYLVLAFSKMEHMSKSGSFPKCKVGLVLLFFIIIFLLSLYSQKKNLGVVKVLSVPKMGQIS